MKIKILITYKLPELYSILKEIELHTDLIFSQIDNEKLLIDKAKNLDSHLVITNKKYLNINNQLVLNETPIKIDKLFEKINIKLLKIQFNNQSEVKINEYIIDLNSRQIFLNDNKLDLTEKEVDIIIYLSKSKKPVSINDLQKNVWHYQADLESHTVETHIYRLKKKILNTFADKKFITNKKNGYLIGK